MLSPRLTYVSCEVVDGQDHQQGEEGEHQEEDYDVGVKGEVKGRIRTTSVSDITGPTYKHMYICNTHTHAHAHTHAHTHMHTHTRTHTCTLTCTHTKHT